MATNFSPFKGSYVLNQFPSNVMFGMNGFHVSASGAIQGHHGPLVFTCLQYQSFENTVGKGEMSRNEQFLLFPLCFPPFLRTFSCLHQIRNCQLQTLSDWKSLKFDVWERVKA